MSGAPAAPAALVAMAAEEAAEKLLDGAVVPGVDPAKALDDELVAVCVAAGAGAKLGAELVTRVMEWGKALAAAAFEEGAAWQRHQIVTPGRQLATRALMHAEESVPDEEATYSGRTVRQLVASTAIVFWNAHQEGENKGRGQVPSARKRKVRR